MHQKHEAEDKNAAKEKKSRFAAVATLISASSSLTVLIEKAVQYWPDIVGWISMVDASMKDEEARPAPFKVLGDDLDKGDTWRFPAYARILEREISSPSRRRDARIGLIPKDLLKELAAACEKVSAASSQLRKIQDVEEERFEKSLEEFRDLLFQLNDLYPDFLPTAAQNCAQVQDGFKPEWWSIETLRIDLRRTTLRDGALGLADYVAGELLRPTEEPTNEAASRIPAALSKRIVKICDDVFAHSDRLTDLSA